MQTFDVLPRAIHQAPAHSGEVNFAPQKSPQQSEQFGDVMERTLNGSSNELPNDEAAGQTANPEGQNAANQTTGAHHHKSPEKSKKSHPAKSHPTTSQNTAPQPVIVNACAAHVSQLAMMDNAIEQKGNSENASKENGNGKSASAIGNSDGALKTAQAQLLTPTAAIGIPSTQASPQNSAGAAAAKPTAGSSSSVVPLPTTTEALDQALAHSETKSVDLKNTDAKAEDAKIAADKDSADASEPSTKDAVSHDLAATSSDPQPEQNTASTDAAQTPSTTPADSKITKISSASTAQGSPPISGLDPGGTSAAKQYMTMQKAEKTQKVAGQTEQELPGNPSLTGEELPTGQKAPVSALSHANGKIESATGAESRATSTLSTAAETNAPAATSITFAPAIATDTRMRMLERTHDIVALHAMRLTDTGASSLHVVVKPGEGVQLSLELRQNAGGIDVHASLHKGDYEHLSQYWPELQQRLEARGVRVGALTTSENFTSTSHQSFQQSKQQQSSNQDSLHAGAFAEFALAGSMTEAPAKRAARATAYRGWETWA